MTEDWYAQFTDDELAKAGDALLAAYRDASALLASTRAEYHAWMNETARRRP